MGHGDCSLDVTVGQVLNPSYLELDYGKRVFFH